MKHIKTHKLFVTESWINSEWAKFDTINELGESRPLPWTLVEENGLRSVYGFELNPSEYYEVFIYRNDTEINVSFTVNGSSDKSIITNSGQALEVFATVIDILNHHLSKDETITTISFTPEKNYEEDQRRFRIYLYYIKKSFPGSRIRLDSHYTSQGEWIGVEVDLPRTK
jgi:hypothetical protein